jgi:hypothetical protein
VIVKDGWIVDREAKSWAPSRGATSVGLMRLKKGQLRLRT